MGMSAAPMSFSFFSSDHAGRVTPAELSITTLGGPTGVESEEEGGGGNAAGTSDSKPRMSSDSPVSEKPVAAQIRASTPEHASAMAAPSAVARSSCLHATLSDTGNTSLPLVVFRMMAVTVCPFLSNSSTTSRPVLPVGPVTATCRPATQEQHRSSASTGAVAADTLLLLGAIIEEVKRKEEDDEVVD